MLERPLHIWYPQNAPALELWEMPYQHIENTIKYLEAWFAGWHTAKRRHVIRPWEVRIQFLRRELRYREDTDYRNLAIAMRKNPKDETTPLILADRCEELGYYVMARRLRKKVEKYRDQSTDASRESQDSRGHTLPATSHAEDRRHPVPSRRRRRAKPGVQAHTQPPRLQPGEPAP